MLRHQLKSMGIPDLMSDRTIGGILVVVPDLLALHEFRFWWNWRFCWWAWNDRGTY